MTDDGSRSLWPYREAKKLIERFKGQTYFVLETGFGPSGRPHIGTLGEVIRTHFVALALRELGYKAELITFADDLDGLRKVPQGMPREMEKYLGKPLSSIPDPFGCCESFSGHMNRELKAMLEGMGIPYHFRSATEEYRRGTFNDAIRGVLSHLEEVRAIILPTRSSEVGPEWSPYFQICEGCGRLYTARITDFNPTEMVVAYACTQEGGCGYRGESSVLNGKGKMTWRVDWPMRWHTFGVHYEIYGKDLIDSARIGREIVKLLGSKPPEGFSYELFLTEDRRKISKSVGEGLTVEEWLRYGSPESLRLLMFKHPTKAKRLYSGVLLDYMDETLECMQAYHAGPQGRQSETYHFITFFAPKEEQPIEMKLNFSDLCNLVGAVGTREPEVIKEYVVRAQGGQALEDGGELIGLIERAIRFYHDLILPHRVPSLLGLQEIPWLMRFSAYLREAEHEAEEIQQRIFALARQEGVKPEDFFRLLYQIILEQERGPRLGGFIKLLGQDRVADLMDNRVREFHRQETNGKGLDERDSSEWVRISKQVREEFSLIVTTAVVEEVEVTLANEELKEVQEDRIKQLLDHLKGLNIAELPTIRQYHQLFRQFGTNPGRERPSPDALLRRVKRDGKLPQINSLVDCICLIMLTSQLSMGAYDLERVHPPMELRLAREGDRFRGIGEKDYQPVRVGELVYADRQEVLCRALNYRDAETSKVTPSTESILLIVDGFPGINPERLEDVLEELLSLVLQFNGGRLREKAIIR